MQSQQRGVFLVGATIAVAIVGMLLTLWMNQTMQEMRIQRAENIGASLQVVGEGVQSFIVKHHGEIGKAFDGTAPVPLTDTGNLNVNVQSEPDVSAGRILRLRIGTGNLAPPTAADIIRIMKLPGVGDKPPMLANADYVIKIFRRTGEQNIHAIIFINRTLKRTYGTDTDWNMMSTAVRKIGVHGGFSKPESPDRFTFPLTPSSDTNTPNDLPNPAPGAGLLAIRAGYLLSPLSSFLRRDGSQAMQGNLQMGGNSIVKVKEISGDGNTLTVKGQLVSTEAVEARKGVNVTTGNVLVGASAGNELAELLKREKDPGTSGHIATSGWAIAGKGIASGSDVVAAGKVRATGDIESTDGNVIAAGSVTAGTRLIIGASGTKLDQSTLTLGTPIEPSRGCNSNGQIGRDASGMFYVCRSSSWHTLKGDKGDRGTQGNAGQRGPQGERGDQGYTGPRGQDGWKKMPLVTHYHYNTGCGGTPSEPLSIGLDQHHMCSLASVEESCGSIYNTKAQVFPQNRRVDRHFGEEIPRGTKRHWTAYTYGIRIIEATCLDFD
ncbi:hypothetical protein PIN31009_04848 [Pandoraea iniqua]|uniref:collagen-like protein n=1 Tax=Pandoraea iniqua TaxID=2508288 RepID=UPI0012404CE4|nr:collagen-like protein [Pandoraea iniqua]VVE53926.1 hypothetical protein PIN31009_04848 [Pandoraea iniqua]